MPISSDLYCYFIKYYIYFRESGND